MVLQVVADENQYIVKACHLIQHKFNENERIFSAVR